ncbi:MAG TPA: cytochrome d ubiquinol oxidase subunit II [Kribbellaceae bacterium]|nr:cytochrome d ubiquinol oxidase subunit II [Kribbellaceae bacterium]
MSLETAYLAVMWIGLTLYLLLGGADFGAGIWDLVAGGPERGRRQRDLIAHTIGPVWEANHVWLIFVIVLWWTGFPPVFAAVSSTLYVPFTLVALGIIGRGSAFVFRKASVRVEHQRLFGAVFALSSLLTPFFLGVSAGAVAGGRVPPGLATGDLVTSWLNPTSLACGVLTVCLTAYLAAVYLTREAERQAGAGERADVDGAAGRVVQSGLAETFRRRGLGAGVVTGAVAVATLFVVRADTPDLADRLLSGRGLVLVLVSVVAGAVSLVLLALRRYLVVRGTAALAVTALLWGWGAAQYPEMLPGLTAADAAAQHAVLAASLGALGAGALLLVPSMLWMFRIFQRPAEH